MLIGIRRRVGLDYKGRGLFLTHRKRITGYSKRVADIHRELLPLLGINELVLGRRSVTADTDLRLARYFGVSEGFFLGLQADHDLLERRRRIAPELARIEPHAA
jgi:hypothetical protein